MAKKAGKKELKEEALGRVRDLFSEAHWQASKNPKLADRYVKLARGIAMKVNLKMPPELKKKFCKYCNTYLLPGKNCRVRIAKKRVTYYCGNCKKFMRFEFKGKRYGPNSSSSNRNM